MHARVQLAFGFFSLTALAFACSATDGGGGASGGSAGSGGTSGSAGAAGAAGASASGGTGGGLIDATPGDGKTDGSNQIAEVYGHSPDTLYRLDPDTKQVTAVGRFQGCSQVIDIALDKDSNLFGTTDGALYKIDPKTAVCTQVSSQGPYPNSLSFVPKGTLDPNTEALVGYQGQDYVRIDPVSGSITTVRAGAITDPYQSSGDIVSVDGGKTFLTIKGGTCTDCIVEVDPATGAVLKNWGNVAYPSVFGLGFWAGVAYGFTSGGVLFQIDFNDMAGSVISTPITIPSAPSGLKFWGAGSTTSAPPVPVPQ